MKIETLFLEDHRAKLTVEVENEQLEGMKRRAANKIGRRVRVPGFRPGKAPYQVIVRQVGESVILEEALELLVDDIYPKVLEEAKISPYGPGKLENVLSMDPPKLEFIVALGAEVVLGDYRSIRKQYLPEGITEDDVEKAIQDLRERQAIIEPVDRPAQEGDLVTVRLSAQRSRPEEGQDPIIIRESSFPIVVRQASKSEENQAEIAAEWPFPGFSRYIVGLLPDDSKTVNYTYPDDADTEELRGVESEYHLAVMNVKSRRLPDFDDEFANSIGEYENVEALRSNVRSALEEQTRRKYEDEYNEDILTEAINQATFKYPPQMLEEEIDRVVNELTKRLERQKINLDLYLKIRNLDMEALRQEMKPIAEGRLKRSLFLINLSEAEKIEIQQDELQTEATSTIDYLSKTLPEREARKLSNKDIYSNLLGNVFMDLVSRRAMERFRDICRGELKQEETTVQGEDSNDINTIIQENTPESEDTPLKEQEATCIEADEQVLLAEENHLE